MREHMNDKRLRYVANDPATLANRHWKEKSAPGHGWAQAASGTLESLTDAKGATSSRGPSVGLRAINC